ncbi:siderophore-interacting protein [Myxococcus sp. K15C18031901]|uniref:siderophore-interacting protein n=1 Tax=Myxococcus dinghuensis TaxID=2906761 RepID=UPI0020A73876|nr:siderophore-interacting protein [Myxococcus dinghuensis]MCP3098508.1 siderophore-interacting protein [Myxococcus dinghuensis]
MASGLAFINGVLGRFLFREGQVARVREVSARFRLVELVGEALRDIEWSAGDKVQVYLPDVGLMRTYTPLMWDRQLGATRFLVYLHGDGPGARWGRTVKVGDRCRFFGPRGTLALESLSGPVVLFGDETSFAVAHTLRALRPDARSAEFVFEVSSPQESTAVLAELGLGEAFVVARRDSDAHLPELEARLREALGRQPRAHLVMTGRAQAIQSLRGRLRSGDAVVAGQKVKAYWSLGKAGLD